eukprot:08315_5
MINFEKAAKVSRGEKEDLIRRQAAHSCSESSRACTEWTEVVVEPDFEDECDTSPRLASSRSNAAATGEKACRPEVMEADSPLRVQGFQREEGEMPPLLRNRIRVDSADGHPHGGNSFLSFENCRASSPLFFRATWPELHVPYTSVRVLRGGRGSGRSASTSLSVSTCTHRTAPFCLSTVLSSDCLKDYSDNQVPLNSFSTLRAVLFLFSPCPEHTPAHTHTVHQTALVILLFYSSKLGMNVVAYRFTYNK